MNENKKREFKGYFVERIPVIGFIVVRSKDNKAIYTIPLVYDWMEIDPDGFCIDLDNDLDKEDQIIGVIPAPPKSCRVYVNPPKGRIVEVGYELNGEHFDDSYWKSYYHDIWEEKL